MNNIQKQLEYFKKNKEKINQLYCGKVIVISDQLDITEYKSEEEAYNTAVDKYGYGNFLLKNLDQNIVSEVHIISPIITSASKL